MRLWLALGMFASMAIAVIISVVASDRAIENSDRREAAAREEVRQDTCLLINRMIAAYGETPPTTPAGVNVEAAWKGLAVTYQCTEG